MIWNNGMDFMCFGESLITYQNSYKTRATLIILSDSFQQKKPFQIETAF